MTAYDSHKYMPEKLLPIGLGNWQSGKRGKEEDLRGSLYSQQVAGG